MCIDTNPINPLPSEIFDNSGIKTPQELCMALLCTSLSSPPPHTEQQQQKEFRLRSQKILSLSQIQILALPLTY